MLHLPTSLPRSISAGIAAVALVVCAEATAASQSFTFGPKLTAQAGKPGDGLGTSVVLTDFGVVAGGDGGVVAFQENGGLYASWIKSWVIHPGPATAAGFGTTVAVGDFVANVVRVFDKFGDSWLETGLLSPAGGVNPNDAFGDALFFTKDLIVVGSQGSDAFGSDAGAVHVFERLAGQWTETAVLIGQDSVSGDHFGCSVAGTNDRIIVGAKAHAGGMSGAGAAYVFERLGATWKQTARLAASDRAVGDRFGGSVALWADVAVIGAPGADFGGTDSGKVYVYDQAGGSWAQSRILTASDARPQDQFGLSVRLRGDALLVSAPYRDQSALDVGAVYLFERLGEQWIQVDQLSPELPGTNGLGFGWAMDFDGTRLVAGARWDDEVDSDAGAVHVLERSHYFGSGCVGSEDVPTIEQDSTVPDNVVRFSLADTVPGSTGLLVIGTQKAGTPVGFGCVLLVGPLDRIGAAPFAVGYGSTVFSAVKPTSVMPYQLTLQAFLREPDAGGRLSATQGLVVPVP